ncbi:MAG: pilus assembly protein TadG-related protein, partial [Acidimicrobiia bacterium]
MSVRRRGEAGVVTLFVVALMAVFVALGGLVVDGGVLLDARRRAINEAEAAARAGAQALAPGAVRAGASDVSVAGAEEAVRRYVAATGH